jgi:hypothetical protein
MEMDVKPPAFSVYSYFTFRPQHTGNWKAEARDGIHVLPALTSALFKQGRSILIMNAIWI